jgi:hypothetical protein
MNSPLQIEYVSVQSLILDPANARLHPDRNLEAIKGSLAKFGQQKPIVVNAQNVVMAGNGTLIAARALGWNEIGVVRSELTGADAIAFGIADNKTSDTSEFDFELLSQLMEGLQEEEYDLSSLGFTEGETETLLAAEWEPPAPKPLNDTPDDLPDEHNAAHAKPISVTPAQRLTIDRAIEYLRKSEGEEEWTEGRIIELICADFLGGVGSVPESETEDLEAL